MREQLTESDVKKIKEEIDLTSSYMVTLKRKYRIS